MNNLSSKNIFWKLFKRFANLNLSLFILSLIVIVCVIGSILEQEQDILYYQLNYVKYYNFIFFLGLDHIFRTLWFISLLIFFVLSLISCTLTTQLPSLKNARRWKFVYSQKMPSVDEYSINVDSFDKYSSINIIYSLIRSNFFVFARNGSIYAYKGLYGRIAPIFVHFSIITVLIGSIYGFFCSFVVQEMIPIGEISHFKNLAYSGFYSALPSHILPHVDDFYINYYDNGSIKQFFSRLSFYFNNNRLFTSKLIYVNQPLNFNNVIFYQTDWQVNGVRLSLDKSYFFQQNFFKRTENNQVFWVSSFSISDAKQIVLVLTNMDDSILICSDEGFVLTQVAIGQQFYLNSTPYCIESVILSTGLQIKYDPSISLVYFGFFIMIVTTFLSYLSYSQIWIYYGATFLNFLGSTNRASLLFEQDVILVNRIYILFSHSPSMLFLKNIYLLR